MHGTGRINIGAYVKFEKHLHLSEIQEFSAQISSKTTLDEYIDFHAETISEQSVDPTHVGQRQKCRKKKHSRGLPIRRYCFNESLGRQNC